MTKATETLLYASVLAVAWLTLSSSLVPLPSLIRTEIVPVLPWWGLVSFGSYALFCLGYDVATFNDKPEKYRELMDQVKQAKTELKARGVDVSL